MNYAGWEPVLCSRTELGFKGSMVTTISKHNPLFPPSPTANTPSESLSAQLGGHDSCTAMMSTPEPYSCAPDVEMPSVVPSLMNIVAYLMFEVRSTGLHAITVSCLVLFCEIVLGLKAVRGVRTRYSMMFLGYACLLTKSLCRLLFSGSNGYLCTAH